jgi:hypothetical protein
VNFAAYILQKDEKIQWLQALQRKTDLASSTSSIEWQGKKKDKPHKHFMFMIY